MRGDGLADGASSLAGQDVDPRPFRMDLGRLARSTVTYSLVGGLNAALSFALLPLLTKYLTPADYGVVSILSLLRFLAIPVFSLGFGTALGAHYFDGKDAAGRATVVATAAALLVVSAGLLAAQGPLFGGAISWLAFRTTGYQHLVTITLVHAGLSVVMLPFEQRLQFEERVKAAAVVGAILAAASAGLSVVFVVGLGRGASGLVEAWMLGQGMATALCIATTAPRLVLRVSHAVARDLVWTGVPVIPGFAFLFALQHSSRYLLQGFDGLDAVGRYGIGYSLGAVIGLVMAGLGRAWLPYFMSFRDQREEARLVFGRVVTYYVLGCGSLSLLFYVWAKPVVMVMTAPAFWDASGVVGLSATAQVLLGAFGLLLPGMYFAGRVRHLAVVQGQAAAIGLVAGGVLVHGFGLVGAGLGPVIGAVALVALQHRWNLRQGAGHLQVHYEWRRVGAFLAVYLFVAGATVWPREWTLGGEMVAALVGTVGTLVVAWAMLTSQERRLALARLRGIAGYGRRTVTAQP